MKASYVDPASHYDDGGEDVIEAHEGLIQELLRYRAVREAALHLDRMFKETRKMHPSGARLPEEEKALSLDEVSLWQLALAFARLMKETGVGKCSITIELDERTVEEYLKELMEAVERRVEFIRLIKKRARRTEVAGYFLAVLEGVRRGHLEVYQSEPFGRLYIKRKGLVVTERGGTEEAGDKAG